MRRQRTAVGWLWLPVGGVAALVVVLVLVGCGSEGQGTGVPPAGQQAAGEDVVLFAGGEGEDKAMEGGGAPKAPMNDKMTLPLSGKFIHRELPPGGWERHRFDTRAGKAYQVEIFSLQWQDDPDLYVGRKPGISPWSKYWRKSTRDDQYMDGIVFKAAKDGPMYVVVHGYSDGYGSGEVDYTIHARSCRFATFTQ